MDYYIDKRDFKVYEECPDYIPVDAQIAPIVAKLMSLGYEILTASAGSYEPGFSLNCGVPKNTKIADFKDCKTNKHCFIIEERDDDFDFWLENTWTYINILFKEKYEFDNLPDGFILKDVDDKLSLQCMISYYDKFDKMKSAEEIFNELDNKRKLLESWAKNLPKNINKGKVK